MRWARIGGLTLGLLLVVLAATLPDLLDWDVHTRTPGSAHPDPAPPLHGWWELRWFGPGTLPALAIAGLAWRHAGSLCDRLSWRPLLATSYVVGLAWLVSLALVDGSEGLSRVLRNRHEYLMTAREVDDIPMLLSGFIDQIPKQSQDNWPVHVAGHPPGALLFFVALVRLGLGGDLEAAVIVTCIAATIPLAVLSTLRALDAEETARRAAPFVVLGPAAVFMAVSADAVFAALGCWGMTTLAWAAKADREGRRTAMIGAGLLSGLLFGYGVFCSYGFGLLGLVALGVLALARSWRPILPVVAAALGVTATFALSGFAWWEAYPVLRERYWDGIAADRPATYWWWGNVAALLISAGPLLGASIAQAFGSINLRGPKRADLVPVVVALTALAAVVAADISQMSKSEVERIWLMFVPWLLVSCALLPERWRRHGLLLQVATALLVEHTLYTTW